MHAFSPIALFVYARPEHTKKVLSSLALNPEAKDSVLYIFADGPPKEAPSHVVEGIREVRRLIRESSWCGEVRIQESAANRGLADSIVCGVTDVVNRHGKVIVLEDDIAIEPGALAYFNSALEIYEFDESVMQISGFMVRTPFWAPRTGFLRMTTSWGWATWSRAWKNYRGDSALLRREIHEKGHYGFDLDGASFHYEELCRNERGEIKTWAVKWYASVYLRGGLCLYPHKSVVRNLGFDGSGENCEDDESGYFKNIPRGSGFLISRCPIKENSLYLKAMQNSFRYRLQVWTKTRLRNRALRKLRAVLKMRSYFKNLWSVFIPPFIRKKT